jgi:hypothetical protein
LQNKDHNPQTICEHLASYLNHLPWCGFCFKDLNRSWTFYWYAKPKTKEAQGGSLQAQTRERRRTGTAGKIYSGKPQRWVTPGNSSNYFVDRISFQAVADKLIEEHDSNERAGISAVMAQLSNPGWKASRMGVSLHPALVATLQAAWNSKITIMLVMAIGQWIWRGLCVDLHPTPTVTS